MFQKFINSLKRFFRSLEPEDLLTLGTSIGLVFIGFLIYVTWQIRLPETTDEEEIAENQEEQVEEEENEEEQVEEENEESRDLENKIHGYTIEDLKNKIEKKDNGIIFSLSESSEFAIEYEGVTHAVFENKENLSIEEWLNQKINEKGPAGSSLEEQKEFLDIVIIRDKETPLGSGKEVVRINGNQSEELFVPWDDYILSFYYQDNNSQGLFHKKAARERLLNKID